MKKVIDRHVHGLVIDPCHWVMRVYDVAQLPLKDRSFSVAFISMPEPPDGSTITEDFWNRMALWQQEILDPKISQSTPVFLVRADNHVSKLVRKVDGDLHALELGVMDPRALLEG